MKRFAVVLLLAAAAACSSSGKRASEPEELPGMKSAGAAGLYAVLETSRGEIEIRLFQDEAPKTVENFVGLAKGEKGRTDAEAKPSANRPFYDGTLFHRVIPEFMIQGGDPTGTGSGGPGYSFADELHPGRGFSKPGMVAMANTGPDSNGSQFFITLSPTPWLDNRHTIFGEVVRGMEVAAAIAASPRGDADRPIQDQILKKVRIEERP